MSRTQTKGEAMNATHALRCDGPTLSKGARLERPWSCACGATFYGYDSAVKQQYREYLEVSHTD